ncbi:protein inturned-like protein [Dinothrombium tinctorium]|uniref:Protein inturned-like protein n=1 Tax=Dinothrombium tinctorium TaxID=1965070 RepID=A0A443RL42_9ACAR|nr:protein inturned-like protein [Dinothrombium tinctorium]
MYEEHENSCCSVCGSSSEDESSSSTSSSTTSSSNCTDTESELEWIADSCNEFGNVFYLKTLPSESANRFDCSEKQRLKKESDLAAMNKMNPFAKMQRLATWMLKKSKRVKGSIQKAKKTNAQQNCAESDLCPNENSMANNSSIAVDRASFVSSVSAQQPSVSKSTESHLFNLVKNAIDIPQVECDGDFVLLYLTHPSDNEDNDCLVYSFPEQSCEKKTNKHIEMITKLKGMFSTLSQVVNDITGQLPSVAKIQLHDESKGNGNSENIFYAAFSQEFNSILVIALPRAKFSETEVKVLLESITRLIRFLYNSLDAGFKCESHSADIGSFLTVTSYHLFSDKIAFAERDLCFYFNAAHKLMIDDDLSLCIDEIINEYESKDWLCEQLLMDDEINNTANDFLIVGTCLFYKSYLISSHFAGNHLADIICFLQLRGILSLTKHQPIKLVIWRQVYPTSSNQKRESLSGDYAENEGSRYFLLVIAIEYTLFCVLFELPFIMLTSNLKPNDEIINQAIRFVVTNLNRSKPILELDYLLNRQISIFNASALNIRKRVEKKAHKSLSIKNLFQTSATKSEEFLSIPRSFQTPFSKASIRSLKSHSTPSLPNSLSTRTTDSNLSENSESECDDPEVWNQTFESNESSCAQSSSSCYLDCFLEDVKEWLPNNLIFFLDIDHHSKTFFAPIFDDISSNKMRHLQQQFRNCCVYLSSTLRQHHPSISELGTQFAIRQSASNNRFKPKRSHDAEESVFWVIARRETQEKELFACFHVTTNEKQIELDFDVQMLGSSLSFHNKLR